MQAAHTIACEKIMQSGQKTKMMKKLIFEEVNFGKIKAKLR
jgi:hypothetical protein